MKITLPTILTLLRIALLPIIIVVFYFSASWARPACAILFAVAGITDWLDGYLARKLGQHTSFGAFLDPVADKLMVTISLLLLVADDPQIWLTLAACIIISREIVISALREWMAELGKRQLVSVNWFGKIKTVLQMLALFLMLYQSPVGGLDMYLWGSIALVFAAGLTLYSMLVYLNAARNAGVTAD
jgi:CDP-diacylglycerol--glycerol-3-phosphate 3-phosphatidyltransferase